MEDYQNRRVVAEGDLKGTVIQVQTIDTMHHALIEWQDGRQVLVPQDLLVAQADGSYFLQLSAEKLSRFAAARAAETEQIIPVIAEELVIEKRVVERGRVRIRKLVEAHEEHVDEELLRESVDVERVPVNQIVETAPEIRYEGETMIIPLLEEVLVVEKRLFVREELRVTKRKTVFHQPQTVTVRREQAEIERIDAEMPTEQSAPND